MQAPPIGHASPDLEITGAAQTFELLDRAGAEPHRGRDHLDLATVGGDHATPPAPVRVGIVRVETTTIEAEGVDHRSHVDHVPALVAARCARARHRPGGDTVARGCAPTALTVGSSKATER